MGGAYGKGYIQAILDYAKKHEIAGVNVAFEADFAPFQTGQQKAVKGVKTLQYSHSDDPFAGNDPISGAYQMDTSKDKGQVHSIFSFMKQTLEFITAKTFDTGLVGLDGHKIYFFSS